MKTNQPNREELVVNPSEITRYLTEIVNNLNSQYEKKYKSHGFFGKFLNDCKFLWYLKEGRNDFYSLLKKYKVPSSSLKGAKRIEWLFNEFECLYSKLLMNNHALAYVYLKEKKLSNAVFTMEDKKMCFLQKLANNEISLERFNEEFGHYALNAYEISAKRFEEYGTEELMQIAKLALKIELKDKVELEDYLKTDPEDITPVLIALRELAKYKSLLIVRALRYELINFEKENGIEDVFGKSYQEVISL